MDLHPGLGCVFTSLQGGWGLECEIWRTGLGWELQLAVGDGLRGREGGNLQQGMPTEEDQTAMEAGTTAESHAERGGTNVASLSPHTSTCWWTIKGALSGLTLTHQLPSNSKSSLRAGPHVLAVGQKKKKKKKSLSGLALMRWLLGNSKSLSGLALMYLLLVATESLVRAGSLVPYGRCHKRPLLGSYLLCLWPSVSLCIWLCRGSLDPSSNTNSAPCPHWGRPKSPKAASEPDSCG